MKSGAGRESTGTKKLQVDTERWQRELNPVKYAAKRTDEGKKKKRKLLKKAETMVPSDPLHLMPDLYQYHFLNYDIIRTHIDQFEIKF